MPFFRRCLIYNVLILFPPRFASKLSPSAAVPSYLTTLNRLCQELFSGTFSASIRFSLFVPLPTCAAYIFYQVSSRLSSAFFFLFSKDFLALPFGLFPSRTSPPVPGQLVYYISTCSICQAFFSFYFPASGYNYDTIGWYSSFIFVIGGNRNEPNLDCRRRAPDCSPN